MSYDIHLYTEEVVADVGNYTSNCAPMWDLAMKEAGADFCLRDIAYHKRRMHGSELAPILVKAVAHMSANPDVYRALNPPNGWGKFESAFTYLRNLCDACKRYPDAIVYVSN